MLPDLSQTCTESIINDDTQHLNDQIVKVEKKRSRFLICILLLQGIWIVFLRIFISASNQHIMLIIPTFLAAAFMLFDFSIRKVERQKVAKFLFFYTLLKSLFWTLAFVFMCLVFVGIETKFNVPSDWDLVTINMVVEFLTGIFTLKVIRLTNQYFDLVNKKMSIGVTEDDIKYNC